MSALIKFVLVILSSIISANTFALCSAPDVSVNFDKELVIQRDLPVGSVLATVKVDHSIICDAKSSGTGDGSWYLQLSGANEDYGASPLPNVRLTGIKGIGIRWTNFVDKAGTSSFVSRLSLNNADWNRGLNYNGATAVTDTFELIKTSTTPITDVIPAFVLSMEYSTPVSNNVMRYPLYKYLFTPVNAKTVSCQVINQNFDVDMGKTIKTKFKGIGSINDPIDFSIGLECDKNAAINVTIDNVSPLLDRVNGVLGLDSNSTAGGVGVQILYNNSPIKFGETINVNPAIFSNGIVNVPFKAAYYQTETVVKPGSVYANLSFTVKYK